MDFSIENFQKLMNKQCHDYLANVCIINVWSELYNYHYQLNHISNQTKLHFATNIYIKISKIVYIATDALQIWN